jgi:hypothetical protein
MKTNIPFYHISLNSSQNEKCFRKVVEKIKTCILCSKTLFNHAIYDNVKEYCRPGQATDDRAHAHFVLDT